MIDSRLSDPQSPIRNMSFHQEHSTDEGLSCVSQTISHRGTSAESVMKTLMSLPLVTTPTFLNSIEGCPARLRNNLERIAGQYRPARPPGNNWSWRRCAKRKWRQGLSKAPLPGVFFMTENCGDALEVGRERCIELNRILIGRMIEPQMSGMESQPGDRRRVVLGVSIE